MKIITSSFLILPVSILFFIPLAFLFLSLHFLNFYFCTLSPTFYPQILSCKRKVWRIWAWSSLKVAPGKARDDCTGLTAVTDAGLGQTRSSGTSWCHPVYKRGGCRWACPRSNLLGEHSSEIPSLPLNSSTWRAKLWRVWCRETQRKGIN